MHRSSIKSGMLVFLLALATGGCHHREGVGSNAPLMLSAPQVNARPSGYAAQPGDWKRFLGCWRDGFAALPDHDLKSALQGQLRPDDADQARVRAELDAAEKRLGVRLPRSYRDFMLAFAAAQRPAAEALDNYTGLLPPNQIGFVRDLAPYSVQLAAENPWESFDSQYLVYGEGQDDASYRSSYVPLAIFIGKYGEAMFEDLVLYPQLVTEDGEMEAAMGFHAGQFRAPSFAELMRQLSLLELGHVDSVPPYPQTRLRGTCAERLTMREVWWK
jgi:hypothetical protein